MTGPGHDHTSGEAIKVLYDEAAALIEAAERAEDVELLRRALFVIGSGLPEMIRGGDNVSALTIIETSRKALQGDWP